jgi:two-component system sensor histidine kinase RegB
LPARYVWGMAAITAGCYSLLLFRHVPLPNGEHLHAGDFGVHVFGMWIGFMLSAGLIAGFSVRMNATLRERERVLAELREQALRQEQVVALGTLAAGAAHELGTPLSTMAVLIKDIEPGTPVSAGKLEILRTQIARCKEILTSLTSAAGQVRAEAGRGQALDVFLKELFNRWRALRPGVEVSLRLDGMQPAPVIVTEQTLMQAITNILNNAADASPHNVEVDAHWTNDELVLEISDRGPGLAPELAEVAGQPFVTTKAEGLGLGLFLAHTSFRRFGGEVVLVPRDGGGTLCRLTLPLATLTVNA